MKTYYSSVHTTVVYALSIDSGLAANMVQVTLYARLGNRPVMVGQYHISFSAPNVLELVRYIARVCRQCEEPNWCTERILNLISVQRPALQEFISPLKEQLIDEDLIK
jgi:hypothetical protein